MGILKRALQTSLNLFVAMSVVLTSTTGYANSMRLATVVQNLNEYGSFEGMRSALKAQFTTQEDHKGIDADLSKIKEAVTKWMWRYEVSGDSIAFRVNGAIAGKFKILDVDKREFLINGKSFVLSPGMSYMAASKKISEFTKSDVASFQDLFIGKAHAALPFLPVFISLGFLVGIGRQVNAATINTEKAFYEPAKRPRGPVLRCIQTFDYASVVQKPSPYYRISGIPNNTWFRSDANGYWKGKVPASTKERLSAIAYNYVTGHHKFSTIDECVERKQHRANYGWLMKPATAQLHCEAGWLVCQSCGGCGGGVVATPVVPVGPVDPTPVFDDKPRNPVIQDPTPVFNDKPNRSLQSVPQKAHETPQ